MDSNPSMLTNDTEVSTFSLLSQKEKRQKNVLTKERILKVECENELLDHSDFLMIDHVKIFPSKIQFLNAFEGKRFERSIEILNCGSKSAFIRIEPFSNPTFQIKCFPAGIRICPGMKIVRKLTYTYQQHNTLYLYTLPIIVNDQNVAFKITILPSVAKISIDTTLLDFGLIDVGHNITRQSFKIRNSGSKPARFSIDLGSTAFQMGVDPTKGVIQPYSEHIVHVEIGSTEECCIRADIFVNSSNERFKISLIGTIIVGRLEVVNLPSCFAFTMVEFPRTYYGAKTTRRLVVRNNSTARTVFCAVYCDGENEGKPFIHDVEFSIAPLDGRFEPREARIFTIDYKPLYNVGDETYHFTTLVVKKLNYCKDMNVSDYPSGLYNTLHKINTSDSYRKRYSINSSKSSSHPSSSLDDNKSSSGNNSTEISCNGYNQDLLPELALVELESVVKLCLHGEPEKVNVSCIPDTLILKHMKLNQSIDRIVNLKNNSIYLPIKFVYEKVPFIKVYPKSVTLRPLASIDIKIVLTCFNIGRMNTKVCWSLYDQHSSHGDDDDGLESKLGKILVPVTMEAKVVTTTPNYNINPGITPKYIRESGQYFDNVKYNTKGKIPKLIMDPIKRKERKDDKAVIAFPNDRPKTLRVIWNNNNQNVETIYAKLPRVIASTDDFYLKKDGRCFYNKYLQQNRMDQLRTLHKNALPEYEQTKLKQFLIFRYFAEGNDVSGDAHPTRSSGILEDFMPLTPIQLNNIKVVPMHIAVGMMAVYSQISNSFEIINNNDVYIRIYIIPEKHRFTFPDGDGTNIHPRSRKTINFIYFSEFEGIHNIVIRIIVNEMHIFEITMMAHVVARKLYVSPHHIVFGSNDPPRKFITFYNPLNVCIDYEWKRNESNFIIEPFMGKILPHKEMACMITYDPLRNKSNDLDLSYSIDQHIKNRYNVRAETAAINTVLCDDHLNFGFVGCNLQQYRHALLWNQGNYSVELSIGSLKPTTGLKIYPQVAVILPGSCQLITVQLQSVECITFHHTVHIMINGKPSHNLNMEGHVLFPNVKFSPNPIRLKKMPVTSFQKCMVTLTNKTKAPTHLSFNFKHLMNYPISDTKDGHRFEYAEFTLEPSESKQLFLQIDPTNVTSMWYLIPFVINYILGPPMAHMTQPTKTKTYIIDTVHKLPDTFPILKIFSTIVESDFTLSKTSFRFVFHPFNEDKSICSECTVFKNISDETLEFCIRLDDIAPPFEIEFETGKPVTPHPFSITMALEPGEFTTFCITYRPTKNSCLSHYCALPFYVRDDYINDKHNYLVLRGTFVLPEILAPKFIYLEFLPLKFRINKTIRVLTNNHKNNCEIFAKSPNPNLQAVIKYIRRDLLNKSAEMEVTIVYTSLHVEAFETAIHIHCDCGGGADILCYGVAENSIFTNFRVVKNVEKRINLQHSVSRLSIQSSEPLSHILADPQISFPYFPEESDVDFKFLTDTLAVLETWLYCQGFCGQYRYSIPETFARIVPIPTKKQTNDLKATNVDCTYVVPYVELLKLIASNQIADQFNWRINITSKGVDRSYQLYCLYTNILHFLQDLNAYFPHVEPELLMSYEDYKIYMTNIKVDCKKLSATMHHHSYYNFILLSKQAWMDVILQTLKVFILGRINIPTDPRVLLPLNSYETDSSEGDEVAHKPLMDDSVTPKLSASERSVEFHKFIDNNWDNNSDRITLHHIYSNSEYFLLNWVSYCFCKSIGTICKHSKSVSIKEKFVNDFDSCFTDSLLIVAAIVTYCPYLKKYFNNLYWVPSMSEHLHHNAVRVVQALALINCSFELRPCNIYNPINIQMALFVAYLYEFLPSMYPHTTINVGAKLSKTSSVKITIDNDSDFDISYHVTLCQNDHRCFNETRSTLKIKPRSKEALKIKYTARYIKKVTAILILCGETLGNRYAKSIAYTLIGEPDVSYICKSYTFSTRLYSTKEHVLSIKAPYKVSACYDIFFSLEPPTSYDTLLITDYNDILKYRFPCYFNYYTAQIMCNEQGEASINITGVAMSLRSRKLWFFLRNAQQGDFLIYVEMVTAPTKEVDILKVYIPNDIYNKRCVCLEKGKKFCKKFVNVNIPKTNLTMLEAFTKFFVSLKGEDEEEFWTAYLKKISSIRHMKKVLHGTYNKDMELYLDLLIMDKTYNVKIVPDRSDVICPPSIDITNLKTDYTKERYAPLAIHVGNIPLRSLVIELWNATHKELRRYKIMFDKVTKC